MGQEQLEPFRDVPRIRSLPLCSYGVFTNGFCRSCLLWTAPSNSSQTPYSSYD